MDKKKVKGEIEAVLKMFLCKPSCCRPEAPFFVAPRRQPRGPSALACLGKTSRSAVPNEVRGDAVPSEVRDASLSLGRTE
jgi:hypothetical protein